MKTRKLFIVMILMIILVPARSDSISQNNFTAYIESFAQGSIDWDKGLIYGVGRGYLDKNVTKIRALRAAQVIASGNIVKLAAGLRLDDRRTMESLGKDKVTIKLKAFLKIQKETKKIIADPKRPYYEVTQVASMKGLEGLTSKLISHLKSEPVDWIPPPLPSGSTPDLDDEDEPWLVLDARKIAKTDPVKPAIFPKIVTGVGETIYSLPQVNEAALVERGMASYVTSDQTIKQMQSNKGPGPRILADLKDFLYPTQAYAETNKKNRRKRQKFIITEVKEAEGLLNTNLVISANDAIQLKSEDVSSQILKNCRVIVVVSSPISGIEGKLIQYFAAN